MAGRGGGTKASELRGRWLWVVRGVAALAGVLGAGMVGLGLWLVLLGGSLYYLVGGLLLLAAATALWLQRYPIGLGLLGLALAISLLWSLWEIAGKGWMPAWGYDFTGRMGVVAAIFLAALVAWSMEQRVARQWILSGTGLAGLTLIVSLAVLWERVEVPVGNGQRAIGDAFAASATSVPMGRAGPPNRAEEWTAYGGSNLGHRYSPADQITPANVRNLREVWRFSTEAMPPNDRVFFSAQNTPLKIDGTLYVCSSGNRVFALDAADGTLKWRFDPKVPPRSMESLFSVACRAVGYHENRGVLENELCARRVFVATADGRLIGLDARSGQMCQGFGEAGVVDLTEGMAMGEPGFASNTSGPTVAGNFVIVGQQVSDNQRRDAPSGVVRAYDATSGEFRWAWDAKRLDRPQRPLADGEIWPQGTPNVWNVISADEEFGMVFLGTGNAANDHFGGNREKEDDEYSSAVVGVALETGETRWVYRTVERDRWDYDIGAQPVITDLVIDNSQRRVVIQATKTGSLFVLDAKTGQPLRPVAMKPAPPNPLPGEVIAPLQPQSTFYPNFAGAPGPDPEVIDARHAFGVTPLDAAWCRIQFHRMRYEGMFTPPTEEGLGMLLFPGTIGGPNWGGIALDRSRNIVITNHSRLPNKVQMIPRAQVKDVAVGDGGARPDQTVAPQKGAPWGVVRPIWMSPLQIPCISPPWGYLAATDLDSGALLWSRPLGTGYDMGPLGVRTRIGVTIGTANIGGAVTTVSGLTFIAAAQDNYLRAFETATGRLLWRGRLPAGGQSGPMTYMHGGRQYVAIGATGHARLETKVGDTLVVFALEE
jgi:quinoprotein glucose dehydrogenase